MERVHRPLLALPALALVLSAGVQAAEPLTLKDAMARARDRSHETAAAGARKEAAAARSRQAAGFRLPSVTLSEVYVRTDSPAESFAFQLNKKQFAFQDFVTSDPTNPGVSGTAMTRAEAVLPLFTGGELSGKIAQAESAARAAEKSAGWTADNVALAAGEAYVMVSQAEEYAALLQRARTTVAAHVELARAYAGQGMLVRSEVLRAEVELARIDDLLEEARGRVRVANANLAFRLGEPQDRTWELAPLAAPAPLEGDAGAWVQSAAARNDLGAARDLLSAGEREESVRKANFLPKLALVGRYDLYGQKLFGSEGRYGTVMAALSWNVFAGGSDHAASIAAREEARAGREDVARFAEGVALEVRQSYEEAVTARARQATAVRALEAAREAERITTDRFQSGVVKMLDVLDASTARREAETRELVARADSKAATLRLAVKAGRRPESVLP
jgi:outer membrane protein TolC